MVSPIVETKEVPLSVTSVVIGAVVMAEPAPEPVEDAPAPPAAPVPEDEAPVPVVVALADPPDEPVPVRPAMAPAPVAEALPERAPVTECK